MAEEKAEAERAKRLAQAAAWLPKAETIRARILDAMLKGYRDRDAIVRAAVGSSSRQSKDVVTALTKEKNTKVPLWQVDGEATIKYANGCLALV